MVLSFSFYKISQITWLLLKRCDKLIYTKVLMTDSSLIS